MNKIQLQSLVTGKVWKIEKNIGDAVITGESVLIVESMKMEIPLETTVDGTLVRVLVAEGDMVEEGQILAVVTAN
ncbi:MULTISPECIES: acetyl-CoA carboxylase biotin carboxyl carrier protein subunit [unclassified Simplicispira]|uniref:acetyl-CoA carboxylase biotin carboxyl carrier protein subunit n=1 Tax=unclassified Simplicispira TaxID=2630407 RepID=UPI000D5DB75B|nr:MULTISPECIES: acetyl-CoA carboxylase biotin carboxyl carrier protein subunit [unclassified Simplicispira]PVY55837.1 biotin-dependent enzyme [Simplicispira sp. 125]REG16780.1 biotin-dependent enzyme [Simplicispira sp. 110]